MNALVIYTHPNTKSFNKAILDTVRETLEADGVECKVSDLYATNWNPVLSASDLEGIARGTVGQDVAEQQDKVRWADLLIFIYPIWWLEQPSMLKGWIDRVFTHGFAYRMAEWGIEGLLRGKKALVITTTGSDEASMGQVKGLDAIKTCMIKGTLGFTGITDVEFKNFFAVPLVTDGERKHMLEEAASLVRSATGKSA